jgi:Spx/MgsR family transcriptional regulator
MILYGISNCDSTRKARKWLKDHAIDYRFHDVRSDGLDTGLIERLEAVVGWEKLLNRRSTSWRQLNESERSNLSREKAMRLMLAHPTLIKRPLLETGTEVLVGFADEQYRSGIGS